MDIAALASSMKQTALSQAVGLKVLAMAKNQAQEQSQMTVEMLSAGVSPTVGRSLDIKV